jgi:hypothetical protein
LIPDGVIEIFHSGRTKTMVLNQLLTENQYQEYFLGEKAAFTTFMCQVS